MSVSACIPCTPDRRTREDPRRRPVEGADRARHRLRAAQQLGQAHICGARRVSLSPRPARTGHALSAAAAGKRQEQAASA